MTLLNFVSLCVMRSGIFPCAHRLQNHAGDRLPFLGEFNFPAGARGAIVAVRLHGVLEILKPFARVVEIRDGFDQPPAGQIHQQTLKFAEGLAGLKCLRGSLHRFVRLHALDIHKRPPDILVAVLMAGLAVARRNHNQRAPGDIGRLRASSFFRMWPVTRMRFFITPAGFLNTFRFSFW
jgi:hypothetical protein